MSDDNLVLESRRGDVVTLTFNQPKRLNAMTQALGEVFATRISGLQGDASIRAVVLTGAGRAFSAGGDLGMIQQRADEAQAAPGVARRGVRDAMHSFYKLFLAVRDLECPTLAAINGPAIGAGLCVALACDVRFVAEDATLGLNFTKLGLHPGMGATWTLPRLVGPALAAELLFTSRMLEGREAAQLGMANRALPPEEVLPATLACADAMAGCAPLAVRGVKQALARSLAASLDDQLAFEASEQSICFESADVNEGIAAVRDKRSPVFRGE